MNPTINQLDQLAAQYPRLSFFFSAGRLCISKDAPKCPFCGGFFYLGIIDGCLGFEGLSCLQCERVLDAWEDANRDSAAEAGRGGALYSLNLRGV